MTDPRGTFNDYQVEFTKKIRNMPARDVSEMKRKIWHPQSVDETLARFLRIGDCRRILPPLCAPRLVYISRAAGNNGRR